MTNLAKIKSMEAKHLKNFLNNPRIRPCIRYIVSLKKTFYRWPCWRCMESVSIPTGQDSFHAQRSYNGKTMALRHAAPNCTTRLNICKTITVCQ